MNRYLDDDESESSFDDDIDIHEIVRVGTFEEVKEAIALDRPRLIALKDEFKRTALHYAAELNRIKVAVFLIAKQANVNAADEKDQTPLLLACAKGLTDMARTLLEFNADIKLRDKNCCTALHLAVEANYFDTATLLVKRGVDINAEEYRYGRTALHIAAEKGYTEMATMLLIRGADMYASGDKFYSRTPLHLACIHGHTEVVRVLVKRGADVAVLSGFLDMNPLHLACEHGHWEAAEILINKGMDLDTCGNHINGSTPLHICAQLNRLAIMQILIEKGANMEKLGRFSTIGTALHVACTFGNAHAANLLIEHGADRNARDETGHTPLHYACKSGQYDCAFMLIDLEADVTVRAVNGKLAFDYIAVPTMKEKILTLSAEVQRRIEARLEAERIAAEAERERQRLEAERVERLRLEEEERIRQAVRRTAAFTKALRSVADISGELSALLGVAEQYPEQDINVNIVHPTTEYKSEAFQYAVENDYDLDSLTGTVHSHTTVGTEYEVYRLVNGLYVSSALTRAALRGFVDVVQGLLQWPGVNINYQESNGNTALHNAALIGSREIVEMLLLAGANLTVLNRDGKVAANLARTNYLREIIRNPRLMTTRLHYQERVLDHLFLRQRCQQGQALTLQEAVAVNEVVEYAPAQGRRTEQAAAETALVVASTDTAVVPALALDSLEGGGSPPPHKSKYYKPPKRKATDLHQPSVVSQSSVHQTGVGGLKSILKHADEGNSLAAPPVVIFTPTTVPRELAHLFPHNAMAVPPHVQSALILESSWADGTVLTELPPFAAGLLNNIRMPQAGSVLAEPMIDNILRKHGPLPGKFGGCVSDFFALHSNPTVQESRAPQQQRSGQVALFLDLLTLQRSYVPSAFDTTDEWNEIRDFLWLLGEPFKPTKVTVDGTVSALSTGIDGRPQSGVERSASVDEEMSLCSELTDHHQTRQPTQAAGQRYLPFLQYQVTADRRYFLYRVAVTMNNIQAAFTATDHEQTGQQHQQQRARSPASPRLEAARHGLSRKQSKTEPRSASNNGDNNNPSGLPRIPFSPGKNIGRKGTEDGSKTPVFLSSPVAQIKRALSLESQAFGEELSVPESSNPMERGLDWTRIPKNLSRADVHRLVRFTRHCEEYVQWVLQLYAPKDYGWPNEMLDAEGRLVTQCVRYNVMYLQYYGLATAAIEEHLLNLVDLSYTAVFVDPPVSGEQHQTQGGAGQRKVSFAEPSQTSLTAGSHYSTGHSTGTKRRAPDLLYNPPRYLRLAVDAIFEVSEFIKQRTEMEYPTDSVRAHLLAQAGRAVIAQQCTLAAQSGRPQGPSQAVPSVAERSVISMPPELSPLQGRVGAEDSVYAMHGTFGSVTTVPDKSDDATVLMPQPVPRLAHSIPQAAQVACRRWLADLLLIDYEPYFQHQGFRLLTDFVGLTEQDCFEYFPFLKAGDLRRLARAAPLLTDEIIAQYAADV